LVVAVGDHVLAFVLGQTAEHDFDGEFESHRLLPRADDETGEFERGGGGDELLRLELNDAESVRVAVVGDERDALRVRQGDKGLGHKETGDVGDDGHVPGDLGIDRGADEQVGHADRNRHCSVDEHLHREARLHAAKDDRRTLIFGIANNGPSAIFVIDTFVVFIAHKTGSAFSGVSDAFFAGSAAGSDAISIEADAACTLAVDAFITGISAVDAHSRIGEPRLSNANALFTFAIVVTWSGGAPAVITNRTGITVALSVALATVVGRVDTITIQARVTFRTLTLDTRLARSGTDDAPVVQTHAISLAIASHAGFALFASFDAVATVVANTFGTLAVDAFLSKISAVHAHARICKPRQAHANAFLAFAVIAARSGDTITVLANTIVTVVVRVAFSAIVGWVHAISIRVTHEPVSAQSFYAFLARSAAFHAITFR